MKVIIETPRFILRHFELEDTQSMFDLDTDPEVMKYIGGVRVKSKEESANTIKKILAQHEEFGVGRLVVADKETGEFLGWNGLKYEQAVRPEKPYYDLGYRLKKAAWGRGVATETAVASLKYGFETLGLNLICAAADINNVGSNNVLKKIGMKYLEDFFYEGMQCHWYEIENS